MRLPRRRVVAAALSRDIGFQDGVYPRLVMPSAGTEIIEHILVQTDADQLLARQDQLRRLEPAGVEQRCRIRIGCGGSPDVLIG